MHEEVSGREASEDDLEALGSVMGTKESSSSALTDHTRSQEHPTIWWLSTRHVAFLAGYKRMCARL